MTNQELFLGKVNFFDGTKGFGFIRDLSSINEYFIHALNIKTNPLIEDDIVVFKLKVSKNQKSKYEATSVFKIEKFTANPDFLILKFYEQEDVFIKRKILKALPIHCIESLFEKELNDFTNISNNLDQERLSNRLYGLIKLFEDIIEEKRLIEILFIDKENDLLEECWVKFWLNRVISIEPEISLIGKLFKISDNITKARIFEKLNLKSKLELFESFIIFDNLAASIKAFLGFIYLEKELKTQSEFFLLLNKKFENVRLNLEQSFEAYKTIKSFFYFKDEWFGKSLINLVYSVSSDLVKLKIWLNYEIKDFRLDIYQTNFILLNTEEQQTCIKKLFYLLSINERWDK